jgi:hypothetical protein
VLVVDDDAGQRMVMRAMLAKAGYFEVVTAEDGEQVASPNRPLFMQAASPNCRLYRAPTAEQAASPDRCRHLFIRAHQFVEPD